jgi:hypothetical protein
MRHPEITTWTDHARGLGSDNQLSALRQHRASCAPCRTTLRALQLVAAVGRADAAATPPAWALRSVQAFFTTRHPQAPSPWRDLRLQATFDSSVAPAPAGIRSRLDDRRQLLFESDDYIVELSLDQEPGSAAARVCGQIFETRGEPRSHTPVFLVGKGGVLGRAISQRHGYFELTGRLARSCELWVFPDDESRIRLDLGTHH